MSKTCKVEGCDNIVASKGVCPKHYYRMKAFGDPNIEPSYPKRDNPIEYSIYNNMKRRCYEKHNKSYQDYGGRGIGVCDRWLGKSGFSNFLSDMGKRPGKKYSLDRIDANGNYEPSNCRWATRHEQSANRRNRREHTGVWKNKKGYWSARLIVDGVRYEQRASNEEEAIKARRKMENKYL